MHLTENVRFVRLTIHNILSGYPISFPDNIVEAFLISPMLVTCSAQSDPFRFIACIVFIHTIYY